MIVVKICQMQKREPIIILEREQEDSIFISLSCLFMFTGRNGTFCVASDSQPSLYKGVLMCKDDGRGREEYPQFHMPR